MAASISQGPAARSGVRRAVRVVDRVRGGSRLVTCPRPRRPHHSRPTTRRGRHRPRRPRRARSDARRSLAPGLDFSASFPLGLGGALGGLARPAAPALSPATAASSAALAADLADGRARLLARLSIIVADRLDACPTRPRPTAPLAACRRGIVRALGGPRRRAGRRIVRRRSCGIGHGRLPPAAGAMVARTAVSVHADVKARAPRHLRAAIRGRRRPTTADPAVPSRSATGSVPRRTTLKRQRSARRAM